MKRKDLQKGTSIGVIVILIVLSFLVLKEIIVSILAGVILGFIFLPLYEFFQRKFNNKNLSASLVCGIFIIGLVIPLWFLTPLILNQSIQVFISSQQIDFVSPVKSIFPSLFSSPEIASELGRVIRSFVTNLTSGAMNAISSILLDFPTIFLHLLVTFFIFFYVLRDNKEFVEYIQSILPFSESVEKRLFKSSKEITSSILYGQIVVGILQGAFAGLSFFLFGVPNALFLTLVAAITGILPVVGTSLVWIPVAIYVFLDGSLFSALGIIAFGLLASFFENSIKPTIVSRRTNVHPGIILIGMIGGIFFLGLLGVIIGPLILSYLLIVLELYRDKKVSGIFLQDS